MAEHPIAVRRAVEAVSHLVDPDPPWLDILRTARDMVGADSGTLIVFDARHNLLNLASIGFSEACAADYQNHYYRCDILERDSRLSPSGTWLDTARMYPRGQLQRSEFYTDFMVKHRMAQILSLVVESNAVVHAAIGFQRSTEDGGASDRLQTGAFGQYFRTLRSQLAQREKALAIGWRSIESAFTDVGEAVLLISKDAMVDKMSTLAMRYLDDGHGWHVRGGRLRHANGKIQALFDTHCQAVARDGKARSLAAASGWGELFWIDISAAPEALNLIGGAMLLVRMRRKSAFAPPDIDRLESVFAITHAEAAVLAGLATGHSVEEVATLRNASVLTVRKQVASLLNKMECSRQSELVRLASLL
ncbi:LuxR family transcriptional regulator [Achromobacter denitrificans]|jgi:DNA-binding CsgD family transcriptional regulator|uniref:helix-turn-helix transcriptional regulator n=1 Tax=Achromobacter denitrificans TaxID=32002 RepID=UPI000B4D4B2B|nr:LuxR C-terminal-related transcriptional regulator [Achromobacter denitrificans]ASC63446.1 LuxR family transcriptional regulator [Achromobacter denitrificans]